MSFGYCWFIILPSHIEFDCFWCWQLYPISLLSCYCLCSSHYSCPTEFLITHWAAPKDALLLWALETKAVPSEVFIYTLPKGQRPYVCLCFLFFVGVYVCSLLQSGQASALWHHSLYEVLSAQRCCLCLKPHALGVPHLHLLAHLQRVHKARGWVKVYFLIVYPSDCKTFGAIKTGKNTPNVRKVNKIHSLFLERVFFQK